MESEVIEGEYATYEPTISILTFGRPLAPSTPPHTRFLPKCSSPSQLFTDDEISPNAFFALDDSPGENVKKLRSLGSGKREWWLRSRHTIRLLRMCDELGLPRTCPINHKQYNRNTLISLILGICAASPRKSIVGLSSSESLRHGG